MRASPYPAPAVCVDPDLGAEATLALGRAPSAAVEAHLAVCLACRQHRDAFDELDANAVPPAPELRDAIRRLALRRGDTRLP